MAFPFPHEQTWLWNIQNSITGGITGSNTMSQARATFLLDLKDWLVSLGEVSVARSSDGVTVADSDLWSTIADIITNNQSTPFSWTVLRFTTGFDLLLSLLSPSSSSPWDGASMSLQVAPTSLGGFTGGDETTNPTAPGAGTIHNGSAGNYSGGPVPDPTFSWHALQSTDGEHTHVFVNFNGFCTGMWSFTRLVGDKVAESFPNYYLIDQHTQLATPTNNMTDARVGGKLHNATVPVYARIDDGQILQRSGVVLEAIPTGVLTEEITAANPVTGDEPMFPMNLSEESVGVGIRGRIPDLYWVRDGVANGAMLPDIAPHRYAIMGNVAFPWDGVAGPISTS